MTQLEQFMAAVAQTPGARAWLDEVLIRGSPDGSIAGAHVIVGGEMPNPITGQPLRTYTSALPIDMLGEEWQQVIGSIVTQQQSTIAARNARIVELEARIAELEASLSDRQAKFEAQEETISAQASEIGRLQIVPEANEVATPSPDA